ncbi:ryanodine receptor [Penaeus vannamei]|uniref:Ryanodine receptor n=1 Tax=Penaeus vannamei TaxID=6689 RepID=A0A423U9Z8_PENVA|nr:ryanodine receptor [Penaeus vannamei]
MCCCLDVVLQTASPFRCLVLTREGHFKWTKENLGLPRPDEGICGRSQGAPGGAGTPPVASISFTQWCWSLRCPSRFASYLTDFSLFFIPVLSSERSPSLPHWAKAQVRDTGRCSMAMPSSSGTTNMVRGAERHRFGTQRDAAHGNAYLACLSTSSSKDKLAFDVGLQEHSKGESCWWTIHPASKQRSEGEKVRVGDDLILVSVATERYLQATREDEQSIVNASFHVTHWSVAPFGTGLSRLKFVACVFGGEVLRFFHGGDECLSIPSTWSDQPGQNIVVYEGGSVTSQARSLWRLELARTKWSGGYINWFHPMRIRHITTGRYLGINENNDLVLLHRDEATLAATSFYLREEKDDNKVILEDKDLEVIGTPLIKYGDSTVIVQHVDTGLWLSYRAFEIKKKGVGKVEVKQGTLHEEGKMDDGLVFYRSQEEESRTARVIRKCSHLFTIFIKGLDNIQASRRHSILLRTVNLKEMISCLEDLINYLRISRRRTW